MTCINIEVQHTTHNHTMNHQTAYMISDDRFIVGSIFSIDGVRNSLNDIQQVDAMLIDFPKAFFKLLHRRVIKTPIDSWFKSNEEGYSRIDYIEF